jgi:RNA-directed DNA polymerase
MSYGGAKPTREPCYYAQRRMPAGNRRRPEAPSQLKAPGPFTFAAGQRHDVAPIVAPENLIVTWNQCAREGGPAPGADGLRYRDLGRSQAAVAMRMLSAAVMEGRYRPQPSRAVSIPKNTGGTRGLHLRSVIDRNLSTAVTTAVTPLIDRTLLPTSYGFRKDRGVADLLAELEVSAVRDGYAVLVDTDIRQAFDYVPIHDAVAALASSLTESNLLALVETILRGHDGPTRTVGIDQGDPLSPITLIKLLDERLDRPLIAAHPGIRSWRFADNHVIAAQNTDAAEAALETTRRLLNEIGMTLKGDPHPVDLLRPGVDVEILGYVVSMNRTGNLRLRVRPRAWERLHEHVDVAATHDRPSRQVARVVDGWSQYFGVCFETQAERRRAARRIINTVLLGDRDAPTQELIVATLHKTYETWRRRAHKLRVVAR